METNDNVDASANQPSDIPPASTSVASGASELQLGRSSFLVVALVAGALFFGVTQAVFPIFRPRAELMAPMPPPEISVERERVLAQCRMLNAVVAMGIFGLLMGGLLGAGEAAARRFDRGALVRLAGGAALSTALGCLGGLIGYFIAEHFPSIDVESLPLLSSLPRLAGWVAKGWPMITTMLAQASMLGLLGIGAGAAVGLVAGSRMLRPAAAAGAAAGILAGILFPVAGSLIHRLNTEMVIPGGVVQGGRSLVGVALWVGIPVLLLGCLIPAMTRNLKTSRSGEKHGSTSADVES